MAKKHKKVDENRDVGVMMRVTPQERERLKRCAARDNRSVANWLRLVVMKAAEDDERCAQLYPGRRSQ